MIGAPFYVMERVEGTVLNDELPDGVTPARIGEELIDALVEVHATDWQACGLEGFGKPTGYLARQVRRFTGLWEHNATREIAALDAVTAWLGEHIPESGPATIVHGDYRLGNVMFTGEPPERDLRLGARDDRGSPGRRGLPARDLGTRGGSGEHDRLFDHCHTTARVPHPRRPRGPLRGALRTVHARPALVHHAGPLEVRDLPGRKL